MNLYGSWFYKEYEFVLKKSLNRKCLEMKKLSETWRTIILHRTLEMLIWFSLMIVLIQTRNLIFEFFTADRLGVIVRIPNKTNCNSCYFEKIFHVFKKLKSYGSQCSRSARPISLTFFNERYLWMDFSSNIENNLTQTWLFCCTFPIVLKRFPFIS